MTASRVGRIPVLTPDKERRILDSIGAGNNQRTAAETADIGSRTLDRYTMRGRTADEALTQHLETLTDLRRQVIDRWDDDKQQAYYERQVATLTHPRELPFWRLWRGIVRARAGAEERAVAHVRQAGVGYEATETVTESRDVLDKDGHVVTLRTVKTVTKMIRDWRAEAWWLERARRDDYGRVNQVEVAGVGGGPIEHRDADALRARGEGLVDSFAERRRMIELAVASNGHDGESHTEADFA